jgi:hypothetical protein
LQINKGNVAHTKEELDKVENMLKEINWIGGEDYVWYYET